MKKEIYGDISATDDLHAFEFVSVGKKGLISKQVLFIPNEEPGIYDLEFGDIKADGSIDYFAISNNGDTNKILATIMKIIDIYTRKYPDRNISFFGNTAERIRLYRMAIGLNLEELSKLFDIYTKEDKKFILFARDTNATKFLIKRKRPNFNL